MSDLNPYAIPDDDVDELLHRSSTSNANAGFGVVRTHSLDATPCVTCNGIIHELTAPAGTPSEVLDSLSIFLDEVPPEIREAPIVLARSAPERARIVAEFLDFTKDILKIPTDGPLLRALSEVLDEMSGGKVKRLWILYEVERRLIVHHSVLKVTNSMIETLQGKQGTGSQGADDHVLISVLQNLLNDTVQKITDTAEQYRLKATEADYDLDQMIVDAGVYSKDREKSPFVDHTMVETMNNEFGEMDIEP